MGLSTMPFNIHDSLQIQDLKSDLLVDLLL